MRDRRRSGLAGGPLGRDRPRILVTGFGPFPGVPFNVSASLVEALGECHVGDAMPYQLRAAVLPTDWRVGPDMAQVLIDDLMPDAVVHFGVSSRATTVQIETRAFNIARCAPDHAGRLTSGHYVRRGRPPVLFATLPAGRLIRDLRLAGIPASLSGDAGRYLCNATLYRSLARTRASQPAPLVGFVHIPALTPADIAGHLPLDHCCDAQAIERGAHVLLNSLARFLRANRLTARRRGANRIKAGLALGGIAHDNRPSRLSDGRQRCGRRRVHPGL